MKTEVRMSAQEVAGLESSDRVLVPIIAAADEFEGQTLTTLTYKGRPSWIAADVGRLLGYSKNGSRLVSKITKKWRKEILPGRDFVILKGQELADFKALFQLSTGSVPSCDQLTSPDLLGSRAPHVMLLFEKGLYGVCLKTNKPIGVRLRDFVKQKILPQVARDGSYLPSREVVDGQLKLRDGTDGHALVPLTQEQVAMTVRNAMLSVLVEKAESLKAVVREEIAPVKELQRVIQADLTELKNRDGVKAATIGEQYGKQLRKRLVEIARQIAPHDKLEQQRQRSLIDYTLRSAIGHHGVGARWEKLPTSKIPEALMELERIVRGLVGVSRNQLPLFGELHVVQASPAGVG